MANVIITPGKLYGLKQNQHCLWRTRKVPGDIISYPLYMLNTLRSVILLSHNDVILSLIENNFLYGNKIFLLPESYISDFLRDWKLIS